jgi:hypothetical protein
MAITSKCARLGRRPLRQLYGEGLEKPLGARSGWRNWAEDGFGGELVEEDDA